MKKHFNAYWFYLAIISLLLGIASFITNSIVALYILKDSSWLKISVLLTIVAFFSTYISGSLGYFFQENKNNPKKMKSNYLWSITIALFVLLVLNFTAVGLLEIKFTNQFYIYFVTFYTSFISAFLVGFDFYYDLYMTSDKFRLYMMLKKYCEKDSEKKE